LSPLSLYAVVGAPPAGPPGTGVADEPLAVLPVGNLLAVVGEVAARPPVTPAALARHDAAVRRLAGLVPALLPARFGECLPDERALVTALAPHAGEIARALTLVEGRVQMTLRVFGEPGTPEPAPALATETAGGPGARYLAARRRAASPLSGLPELAALRRDLKPLLRAERIERPPTGKESRLLATAHDLVDRGKAEEYVRIVERAAGALAGRKLTVSGPWPPYAFAPGALA